MLEFKSKVLTIFINILLGLWQIFCWLPAVIFLAIFHNCELYRNEDAGITVLKVNKGYLFGNACFSCGPVIFVTPECDEDTIRHETGHSVQSLFLGPLFHFCTSIPSIVRFWYRRWNNLPHEWYYLSWPEGGCRFGAEELGHTKRSQINTDTK